LIRTQIWLAIPYLGKLTLTDDVEEVLRARSIAAHAFDEAVVPPMFVLVRSRVDGIGMGYGCIV